MLIAMLYTAVPASFWDPADNGFDIGDAGTLLVFLIGVAGVIWATTKFLLIPKIDELVEARVAKVVDQIVHATAPIQREANGGYSLPDVARKSDWNGEALKAIAGHLGVDLPADNTLAGNVPHDKRDR